MPDTENALPAAEVCSSSGTSVRGFRWLLSASALANLSDGISLAFLPLVAAGLAVSAIEISWIEGARQAPLLFLALPAGVLLDRIDRRSCVVAINLLRGGLFAWLAWYLATGHASVGVLVAFAAVVGALEAVNDVAMPTILPEVVGRDQLAKANGLLSSAETATNYLLGRSLGASLVAFVSQGAASAASGFLYMTAAALCLPLRGMRVPPRQVVQRSILRELCDGVTYVWQHPSLRILAVMGALGNIAFGGVFATLVLYITRELKAPTSLFGALQGAFAIGSILIGWQVSRIVAAFGEWRALAMAVSIIPVAFVVTPLIPSVVTVGVTSLLNGAAAVVWNTVSISHRQRVTPHELLGRATAVFRLVSWGGMPLGAFACGPIAQRWGLLAPYFVFAFVAALNLPLAGLLLRRSRTSS